MDWYQGIEVAKDPEAVLNWRWEWGGASNPWLGDGDTIASAVVTPDTGITVDSSVTDSTGVNVVISGGAAGTSYAVNVEVTTVAGLRDQRTVMFKVVER